MHIRNALVHVLQHPPRQGRAAIAALKALILSPFFPTDEPLATQRLRGSELGSARPALITGIVDEIVFGWPDPSHEFHYQQAAILALFAAAEIHRSEVLNRIRTNVEKLLATANNDCVTLGSFLAVRMLDVGHNLTDASISTVSAWLLGLKDPQAGAFTTNALKISKLRAVALQKAKVLSSDQLIPGQYSDPAPEIVDRGVDLYSKAANWTDANTLAQKCAIPLVPFMSKTHVEVIFTAATNGTADLKGSNMLPSFIRALYDRCPVGKQGLDEIFDALSLEQYKLYGESPLFPA